MADKVKVVVADDHAIWRTGMRADLGEAFWVMEDVADAEAAIKATRRLRPDVVAADLRMPEGGGIRVAAEVADVCPVVILTVSEAESDLLDAMISGKDKLSDTIDAHVAPLQGVVSLDTPVTKLRAIFAEENVAVV